MGIPPRAHRMRIPFAFLTGIASLALGCAVDDRAAPPVRTAERQTLGPPPTIDTPLSVRQDYQAAYFQAHYEKTVHRIPMRDGGRVDCLPAYPSGDLGRAAAKDIHAYQVVLRRKRAQVTLQVPHCPSP